MQNFPSVKGKRSIYIWNLMIRNSTNNGFVRQTLNTYSMMLRNGVHGNNFTFPLLLKASAALNSISHGKILHSHVLQLGFQADTFVQTALIDMYSKCSLLSSSSKVFDEMHPTIRTSVSYNSMVSAYCRASLINQAILALKQMWVLGMHLTASTFVSIVSACRSLRQGLLMHSCVFKLGLINNDIPLANSVMSMYSKWGCAGEARLIFDEMDQPSIISWTTVIGAYVNIGNVAAALSMFKQMRQRGVAPDVVVFVNLISACIGSGNLLLAASIHSLLLKSGCNDVHNLLINMYAKCGDLEAARRVFDMVDGQKSVILWTSMIAGYTQSGYPAEAFHLFKRLLSTSVRPNEATLATVLSACADLGSLGLGKEIEDYILLHGLGSNRQVQTSLIHMFSKCGSIRRAEQVFDLVANKDLAVWSTMIYGYAIHGMGHEALSLFRKMQHVEGIKPDAIVYTGVLLACSHSGLVEDGLMYFESMQNDFGIKPSLEHYICLVDLLGRAGCFDLALRTINDMPVQVQVKGWAPLLSACRKHRNIELGEFVAKKLLTLNPQSTGSYVLTANFYTSVGKWKDANKARRLMNNRGLVKEPGWSQVDIDGSMHVFVAGDRSHHLSVDIYKKLDELNVKLLEAGYIAETNTVIHDLEKEEKEEALKAQ